MAVSRTVLGGGQLVSDGRRELLGVIDLLGGAGLMGRGRQARQEIVGRVESNLVVVGECCWGPNRKPGSKPNSSTLREE